MSIICFLALRTVTQKPLQWFRDNRAIFELAKHDKTSGETKEQKEVESCLIFVKIVFSISYPGVREQRL